MEKVVSERKKEGIFVAEMLTSNKNMTMKKTILTCLMAVVAMLGASAQEIYNYTVKDGAGKEVSLGDYKGKVLLVVNTATRCGFTPQYTELEALYERYVANGLEILDFPCNQFGEQAPGSIQEIHQFCTANYSIRFPQFDKIDVNGVQASPLYTYLKSQKGFGGFDLNDQTGKFMDDMLKKKDADYAQKADIKWNFTKFLVTRDGRVIKRYEPTEPVANIEADIRLELNPITSAIMARRSIRKYLPTPVEHDKLEAVVRCGINAPSGMNRQPWLVRVVEDQQLIADVTEVFKKANPDQVSRDPDFKNMFRNAPNLICICTPAQGGDLDAGLLGENMLIAAQSMGLGTCCLGGPVRFLQTNPDAKFFLDRLDIPADYKLNYIIAIGYPDEQPDARPRDAAKVKYILEK